MDMTDYRQFNHNAVERSKSMFRAVKNVSLAPEMLDILASMMKYAAAKKGTVPKLSASQLSIQGGFIARLLAGLVAALLPGLVGIRGRLRLPVTTRGRGISTGYLL
ncbi:hypothetical protein CHS0354_023108 [Potamilus streckersoni]|uniref:Uncharacterized protein n=1 Tax=Potamilus streckersoni TaxID=2493646 RepID=A0AAE0TFE3_9BIVA|nr:hypothetical protein CHS0354_023108 [Potamilus streckersoni]